MAEELLGAFFDAATQEAIEQWIDDLIALAIAAFVVWLVYIIYISILVLLAIQIYDALNVSPVIGEFGATFLGSPLLPEVEPIAASEGAHLMRAMGRRCPIAGVVIAAGERQGYKEEVVVNDVETTVQRYRISFAIAWGQAFGGTNDFGRLNDIILVIFDGKVVWKKGKVGQYDHRFASWTNYNGSRTQNADSELQSIFGTNKVSGLRDTAYSVIEDFELRDFGNRIPVTIRAIVQADDDGYELRDGMVDLWNLRPGASAATELDVSTLTGKNTIKLDDDSGKYPLEGFRKAGPQMLMEMVAGLIPIFDLTARHSGEKFQILDRGDEPVIPVTVGHLGAAEGKSDSSRPLRLYDLDRKKRPSRVNVNFYSKKHRYQRATEGFAINNAPPGENVVTLNYEGVLTGVQARKIAKRRVLESYRMDKQARFTLPPDYLDADAGDVFAVPFEGQVYYVRAQAITIGANYLLEVEGVVEQIRAGDEEILTTANPDLGPPDDDPESSADDPDMDDPEGPNDDGYLPPLVVAVPMNLPAIFKDKHAEKTGVYYAQCAQDPAAPWKGAKVYRSWTGSGGYKLMDSTIGESPIGVALTAFPDSTAAGAFTDRASTLRVMFFEGAPESATREEVESGANWLAVGDPSTDRLEVCAFMDATPEDSDVVDLTGSGIGATTPDEVYQTTGTSWVTLGVTVGMYVRIDGLSDPANESLFRKVLNVTSTHLTLDVTPGDLATEAPLDADVPATLTMNSNVWVLSNWFRGLCDTTDHVPGHLSGDTVVSLSASQPVFAEFPKSKLKKTLHVKAPAKGHQIGDVLDAEIVFAGETMRPFRPCDFRAARTYMGEDEEENPLYDIELSWLHVTRYPFQDPTTEAIPPHDLNHEGKTHEYEVRIYSDEPKTTLVRSFNVKGEVDDHEPGEEPQRVTKDYTAAQQTSDGVLNAELFIDIWQVGTVVKKGNVLDAYVPAVP